MPVIRAGGVCLLQLAWFSKSARQQLTWKPQRLGCVKSFKPLFDQVSLHLNQKCISTTKDLGKLQRNHKPPWKWKATSSLLPGNNVLYCSLSKSDFFFFLMTSMTVSLLTLKDLRGGKKSLCLPSANNLVLAVGKTLGTSWVLSYFCMNSSDRIAAQHLTLDRLCKSAWDSHKRAHEVVEL